MERKRSTIAIALGALVGSILAFASGASAGGVVTERIGAGGEPGYWTAERIASARPLPLPIATGPPGDLVPAPVPARRGTSRSGFEPANARSPEPPLASENPFVREPPLFRRAPFSSARVPPVRVDDFPFRTNGRLVGFLKGYGNYSCSATVIKTSSDSVILTAGHCLYDHRHGFAKRIAFVPAYDDGRRPFGTWKARYGAVPRGWIANANFSYDYAAIRLKSSNRRVGRVVGESGLAWGQPRRQRYEVIGYPSNLGGTRKMWHCQTKFDRLDFRDNLSGKPDTGVRCDMREGASGGGWRITDGGRGYVNSVTSFSYEQLEDVVFGPYLTRKVLKTVNRASRRR